MKAPWKPARDFLPAGALLDKAAAAAREEAMPHDPRRAAIRAGQPVTGTLNVGPAYAEDSAQVLGIHLFIARHYNETTQPARPITLAPRPLRSNSLPSSNTWEAEPEPEALSPAARARLARITRPAPAAPATLAQGFQPAPLTTFEEIKIMQPTGKFRTLKKGPRAGQTIEEQAMIKLGIWTVLLLDGTRYRFTSRSRHVTRISPQGDKSTLSPTACATTFRRIFTPDIAASTTAFIFGSSEL